MDITQFVLSHRDAAFLLGDRDAYRSQLSRQLATLRKRVGRATPKNAKFSPKPITAEDIGGNPEFAHIIILTAERAWAHAIAMRDSYPEENNQRLPRNLRTHIFSRLIKASNNADLLVSLLKTSSAKATPTDILEAKAYASYLAGLAEFEKHATSTRLQDTAAQRAKWRDCLQELATARVIYAALFKKEGKEGFKEILSGVIDPSLRVAAYQSAIPRTVAVTEVARKTFPKDDEDWADRVEAIDASAFKDQGASGTGAALPNTITWRGRKADIVDASIGQALLAVSEAEENLESFLDSKAPTKDRAAAYDPVLIAAQDAVDAARHAIEEHEREGVAESDSRMQDLRVAGLAVNYELIGWRVGRNRVLIGENDGLEVGEVVSQAPKRPRKDGKTLPERTEGRGSKLARLRDRVVLYDAILQSVDSIKEIRGAARDSAFVAELDGKRAYFHALKCLNIAYSHTLIGNNKNALALLIRAEALSTSAVKTLSSSASSSSDSTPLKLDIAPSTARTLQSRLRLLTTQYRARVDLESHTANSALAASSHLASAAPLVDRLSEYPPAGVDLKNLVQYPPKLQPVPVKPLFFDVAWNYIAYPGGSGQAAPAAVQGSATPAEEEKKPKKGWFGFGR